MQAFGLKGAKAPPESWAKCPSLPLLWEECAAQRGCKHQAAWRRQGEQWGQPGDEEGPSQPQTSVPSVGPTRMLRHHLSYQVQTCSWHRASPSSHLPGTHPGVTYQSPTRPTCRGAFRYGYRCRGQFGVSGIGRCCSHAGFQHSASGLSLCPLSCPCTFRKALFSSTFMITGGMAGAKEKEMSSMEPDSHGQGWGCALTHGWGCHPDAGHHHLEDGLLSSRRGLTQAVPILICDGDPHFELPVRTAGMKGDRGTTSREVGVPPGPPPVHYVIRWGSWLDSMCAPRD